MTHLDLFAGIGGFSLAGSWVFEDYKTAAFVEIDPYCKRLLRANFPGVRVFGDIHKFNRSKIDGHVDLITGGFPCQPFSVAGDRTGESDARYLWPEMARCISEFKPSWIVAENVTGLLTMENERADVASSLGDLNYVVDGIFIIPAAAVGAWHERDRVWIIAHSNVKHEQERSQIKSDSDSTDDRRREQRGEGTNEAKQLAAERRRRSPSWGIGQEGLPYPVVMRRVGGHKRDKREFRRMDNGVSSWIHSSNRNSRIRALGNAIVPQVAAELFHFINEVRTNI